MTDTTVTPLEDQLDEWLAGGEEALFGPPENVEQADRLAWALRKADQRRAEVDALVRSRTDALRVWAEQQYDQLDARRHHLESVLEGWARAQHADDRSRKTWKLPSGMTLKIRPRLPRVDVDGRPEDGTLVAAVGALLPQAIKTTVKVLPGEVKSRTEPGALVDRNTMPGLDVPEGYDARHALLRGDDGAYTTVPRVVLLVPKDGPAGQQFSITRPPAGT
jgi:hypothetical protein